VHHEGERLRVHLVDQPVEACDLRLAIGRIAQRAERDVACRQRRERRATSQKSEKQENQGQTTFSPSPSMKAENVVCP